MRGQTDVMPIDRSIIRLSVILAFFVGGAAVLIYQASPLSYKAQVSDIPSNESVQETMATSVSVNDAGKKCAKDDDCAGATMICNNQGLCEPLVNPVCRCSQPLVLECADMSGQARHTFCEGGCGMTPNGANCL